MTPLRPFFSFYGGKWDFAKKYPAPMYQTIIESFAGSAGYSLHYHAHNVILYEIDPVIYGVWDYLIHLTESELRSLPVEVLEGTEDLKIPQEAKNLIGFWLGRGRPEPYKKPSAWAKKYMGSGEYPGSFWGPKTIDRISRQIPLIRHWKVINESYEKVLNTEATWFVDPPYSVKGSRYKFNKIDYPNLALWCKERKGQAIVCEQEGADWLPFTGIGRVKATNGKGKANYSEESAWISS